MKNQFTMAASPGFCSTPAMNNFNRANMITAERRGQENTDEGCTPFCLQKVK
jgi:hypothetical protein